MLDYLGPLFGHLVTELYPNLYSYQIGNALGGTPKCFNKNISHLLIEQ